VRTELVVEAIMRALIEQKQIFWGQQAAHSERRIAAEVRSTSKRAL
jgi:hypothetical protein